MEFPLLRLQAQSHALQLHPAHTTLRRTLEGHSEQEAPSEASTPADLLSAGQLLDGPEEPVLLKILINGIEHFVDLANPEEVDALAFLQSRSA